MEGGLDLTPGFATFTRYVILGGFTQKPGPVFREASTSVFYTSLFEDKVRLMLIKCFT